MNQAIKNVFHVILGFDQLTELRSLTIAKDFRDPKGSNPVMRPEVFDSIGQCTYLKTLEIQDYEIPSLSALQHLTQLETLVLQAVYVEEAPSPSTFESLSKLQLIDLSRSQHLARQILGNEGVRSTLSRVEQLKLRGCIIEDLEWIPNRSIDKFFPSLTKVDMLNSTVDCQNEKVKAALCRFENLRARASTDDDESKGDTVSRIVHDLGVKLENADSVFCRENGLQTVWKMDFSYCDGENVDIPVRDVSTERSWVGDNTHNQLRDEKEGDDEKSSGSTAGYVILGIVLAILLLVAILLTVWWYRKKHQDDAEVRTCAVEDGNVDSSETSQSFRKLEQSSNNKC